MGLWYTTLPVWAFLSKDTLTDTETCFQIELLRSNIKRLVSSFVKMLKIFIRSPVRSRSMLGKALHTLKPIFRQIRSSGYVFALQLPNPIIRLQGSGGNGALLRMIHKLAYGASRRPSVKDLAESMASSLGPSAEVGGTETETTHERYSNAVTQQTDPDRFVGMTNYYRHDTSAGHWDKSVETVAALYSIGREGDEIRRKSSHSGGVFDEGPEGSLKSKATIVWGLDDDAIDPQLGLDGIADYLVKDSQVVVLPRTQHHTIVDHEGRVAVQKVIEWAVSGEEGDVADVVQAVYAGATVTVRT